MRRGFPAGLLVLALLPGSPAGAQTPYESVGSRALGMAGAFVAVADDVTAAYWNPAGFATGQPIGATIEWSRFQKRDPSGPPAPGAGLETASFGGVGSWPLAVTYGRLTSTRVVGGPDGVASAERLSVRQYGVTVLQTLVPGLVIGSTLKYVRGTVFTGPVAGQTAREALEAARNLPERSSGAFDLDVGLMADLERVRVGLVWKNLQSPEFKGVAGNAIIVPRMTRLGLAVLPVDGLTLAMDLDLDTVDLRDGLRRMIAFGGEGSLGSRLALRAGVRWNLRGERRPVAAAGASLALGSRMWLDGHYSHGQTDHDRGFGLALRAGY